MIRNLVGTCMAFAFICGTCTLARAQDKVVNVYSWQDYFSPDLNAEFTKETGIKVHYDVFSDDETMEAKLLAGSSGYDITAPANAFLAREEKIGIYTPLDKSKLPNWKNVDPTILKMLAQFDPGNKYATAFIYGIDGLAYNAAEIAKIIPNAPVNSWDMIFKPELAAKFAKCGIALLDSPNDVYQIALLYLGKDPNSHDPKDLQAAQDLLMKVRPYIRKFDSDTFTQSLLNGDYCVAMVYPASVAKIMDANKSSSRFKDIKSVVPKEGTELWTDNLAIPADAPHPDYAYAYLNFFMRPEVAAKLANEIKYAVANSAAMPMVDKQYRDNPSLYPTPEALKHAFMTNEVPQNYQEKLTSAWTDLKAAQ
jgi:putrescine transport system substrate-binding protein